MTDLRKSSTKTTHGLSPLLRGFEVALLTTTSADLGKTAVSSQATLEVDAEKLLPQAEQDSSYQGVVEINHSTQTESEQISENTDSLNVQEVSGETVNHSYVGKSVISEIVDNPTPSSRPNPFLAPN